jgi:ankyrin repeat protein
VNAGVEGGHTPLHSAAFNGNAEIVGLLLAAGADPAAPNDDGKTPLDLAREQGHEDVLRIRASNGPSS